MNAEREKFLRTLQQVRENFKSADEDANAETDFGAHAGTNASAAHTKSNTAACRLRSVSL